MDASDIAPDSWREWRRLRAFQLKERGRRQRDIADALGVRATNKMHPTAHDGIECVFDMRVLHMLTYIKNRKVVLFNLLAVTLVVTAAGQAEAKGGPHPMQGRIQMARVNPGGPMRGP